MSGSGEAVRVECYAGHRGEQMPRRFIVGDRRIEVAEVVDAWLAPDHRCFQVIGSDGRTYLLRHHCEAGRWELAESRRRSAGHLE